jgi:Type IV secretion-system coupling protein DNA-binding domain
MHYPHRRQVHRVPLSLPVLIVALAMCAPGLCLAQASPFMTGASALQTNILILRCSASEHGGTSQFASRLIGEREVLRRQISRGSDREGLFARRGARRSKNTSEQRVTEAAVMPSEIEGLPDFCGYLKVASVSEWLKVSFERSRSSDRSGMHGRLRLESKHQRSFK